ncbi:Transmembrane protein 241 [Merluccius polli]|uniref:Transmembrane protein 241 n=1 Tax=Merluccius polli TaxID=89951 RepID=A0AA47N108_MERPO|nr:Transmembrane protein 241 [Merluccius polli]
MQWKRHVTGLAFSLVFVVSYFTNKFVLSVLKFTFPTLFQGWQTFVGAVLLLLSGRLGWVEMSHISRSTALSWLPGSLMFLGSIYAGSRALSHMDIPYFFTLQNASHAVSYLLLRVIHREFDLNTVGVFDQQYINYMFSVFLLALAAHPTGDLFGAWEFPLLGSYTFHWGCCASALLGFLLLLAKVKLKSGLSLKECRTWTFLSKAARVTLAQEVSLAQRTEKCGSSSGSSGSSTYLNCFSVHMNWMRSSSAGSLHLRSTVEQSTTSGDLLDGAVLLDEVDGALGADSLDGAAVVAAQQDAQVYELRQEINMPKFV